MLGELYFYEGITDTNYNENGFFHPTQRPDAKFIVGVNKVDDSSTTTIDLQVCVGDVSEEGDWFFLQRGIDVFANENNGSILAPSMEGVTGIRIIPEDDDTEFSLSVLEYFTPGKIKCITPDSFLVD